MSQAMIGLVAYGLVLNSVALRMKMQQTFHDNSPSFLPEYWWRPNGFTDVQVQLGTQMYANMGSLQGFMQSQGKSHCEVFVSFRDGSMLDSLPLPPSHKDCWYWVAKWRPGDTPPDAEMNFHNNQTVVTAAFPANPEKAPDFFFSVMRWASAHGYMVVLVDGYDPKLLQQLEATGRVGYFVKPYILKLLLDSESVDTVMWMDSDAFILDGRFSIDDLRSIYSPPIGNNVDLMWQWGHWVNTGAIVFYNTEMGRKIVDKWWDLGVLKHFHKHPADQPALHAAVLDALSLPWNNGHKCEHINQNQCMKTLLDANHVMGSQLPGILSIPTPGMIFLEAAKPVNGDLLRLQCTYNPPQEEDFLNGCKAAPSLVVHVGRPYFQNDFHRGEHFVVYLKRMQAGEPLKNLWNM